jgi:ADP-ribose pyrophosphatase YjhB (NUDIX family)
MPEQTPPAGFCIRCGSCAEWRQLPNDHRQRAVCTACGHIGYVGPQLLVLTVVFAEGRLLVVRRGQDPYRGKLAVPGGFVEAGEALEAAAIRETEEEVGLVLEREALLPFMHMSLPAINQVQLVFIAKLPKQLPLRPSPPEVLEAHWFRKEEIPLDELWAPAFDYDIDLIFDRGNSERFDYYQHTEDSIRMISDGVRITKIWPRR